MEQRKKLAPASTSEKGQTRPSRPLRTYSKRATSGDVSEPTTQKRRLDNSEERTTKDETRNQTPEIAKTPSSPQLPSTDPTANRRSILNYFKPAPPRSSSTAPTEPASEPAVSSPTPPSSPPVLEVKRKRRRLTTRPLARGSSVIELASDAEPTDEEQDGSRETAPPDSQSSEVLGEASGRQLNRISGSNTGEQRSDAGKRGAGQGRKRSATPSVQTTLSLSIDERGFVECRECGMLYNPFHEKDVKYHSRRHSALARAKTRSGRLSP